jgi:hypothetical protein
MVKDSGEESMRALRRVIDTQEHELSGHRLFAKLSAAKSPEAIARLARALGCWPMVFQDALRLTVFRLRGSSFESLAAYDWDENIGHDTWYMEDLRALGVEAPTLEEFFFLDFQPIRDVCYQLTAEVHRAESAAERIAFLVALEPTGRLFFEHISLAVERLCPGEELLYFRRSHLIDEKDHDLFVEATRAELDRVNLSDEERARSEQMVVRVYEAFDSMFSYLAERMDQEARVFSDVRELAERRLSLRPIRAAGG